MNFATHGGTVSRQSDDAMYSESWNTRGSVLRIARTQTPSLQRSAACALGSSQGTMMQGTVMQASEKTKPANVDDLLK
jgi:hypothetical protein